MSVLRRILPFGSYHLADRPFVVELALHGRFHNVPDFLYFRRDHPNRASRVGRYIRRRCSHLDPARANRWRHPMVRLLGEYILGFIRVILRAPISTRDRVRCGAVLLGWLARHANPMRRRLLLASPDPAFAAIGAGSWAARLTAAARTAGERVSSLRQRKARAR